MATVSASRSELSAKVMPSGELCRRQEELSATDRIPSGELQQRVVERAQAAAPVDNSPAEAEQEKSKELATEFSILSITQEDVKNDTRVVVIPASSVKLNQGEDMEPFHDIEAAESILIVRQSSKTTDFTLDLGKHGVLRLYYDVASDDIAASNDGPVALCLQPVEVDAVNPPREGLLLRHDIRSVPPGYWRLVSHKSKEVLVEFLLLCRRHRITMSTVNSGAAGGKRRAGAIPEGREETVGGRRGRKEQDTFVISTSTTSELSVCSNSNPILDCQQSMRFIVRSPDTAAKVEQSLKAEPSTSETYSITKLRDIVNRGVTAVFRAKHSSFGDTVVKVIKPDGRLHEDFALRRLVEGWKREVKFSGSLDHPSIVKLYASDARFYSIYMEYLPFDDLTACARRPDWLYTGTEADARRVIVDIASALAYIADRGILHNDIKPGNIIYDRDRGAVLIDFGLATGIGDFTGSGTPQYIAPEVLRRRRGPKSDVFALGITALYLLRKIGLPDGIVKQWRLGQQAPARAWLDRVEEKQQLLSETGIEKVVSQMLEADVGDRISAQEIVDRLQ